jgi:hypothetical protein
LNTQVKVTGIVIDASGHRQPPALRVDFQQTTNPLRQRCEHEAPHMKKAPRRVLSWSIASWANVAN